MGLVFAAEIIVATTINKKHSTTEKADCGGKFVLMQDAQENDKDPHEQHAVAVCPGACFAAQKEIAFVVILDGDFARIGFIGSQAKDLEKP